MTIEEVIKKAIEGWWKPHQGIKIWTPESVMANYYYQPTWALRPEFWQSLGRALRWEREEDVEWPPDAKDWKYQWHRFIDHLAAGKSAEEFFTKIQ